MAVIREVKLRRRENALDRGSPETLAVRVYDHTNLCGGGWFELRGEGPRGQVAFAFRDSRRFLVLQEFDSTVEELLADYRQA